AAGDGGAHPGRIALPGLVALLVRGWERLFRGDGILRWLAVLVQQVHSGLLGGGRATGHTHVLGLVGLLTLLQPPGTVGLPGRVGRCLLARHLLGQLIVHRLADGLLVGGLSPPRPVRTLRWGVALVELVLGTALLQGVLERQLVGVRRRSWVGVVGGA